MGHRNTDGRDHLPSSMNAQGTWVAPKPRHGSIFHGNFSVQKSQYESKR